MSPAGPDGGHRTARIAALLALPLAATAAFVAWPLPAGLLRRDGLVSLRITDRNGGLLHEVVSAAGRSRPLPPDEPIPRAVQDAFIAAEDRRFGDHPGVDPLSLARAALQDLRGRRIVSGASTIAAQLARMLVPRPRTIAGKAGEALWAVRLTLHLDRERLLREYLDRVALGHDLFGVEAAARAYFGRPARTLSLGQAALLAAIAESPERFDPWRHQAEAQARAQRVLRSMLRAGKISAEAADDASAAPLDLAAQAPVLDAPHLVSWIAHNREALGLAGATEIRTTIDPDLQADVELLMRTEIAGLESRNVGQAAAIVVDNASGEVLAYVGSLDFQGAAGGQNDGVRSRRQPGSALKPFAYGLALARGKTAADLLPDVETHLATPTGDYAPVNYDRRVHGPVRLREALANSYNVPAVRLAEELGPDRILQLLRRAGFDSLQGSASDYGVGIVLGDGEVTLRELARAYRGLARGGVVEPLTEIRSAVGADGRTAEPVPELARRRFLPRDAVALLTDILSDVSARAPAFGMDNALRLPFPVAAKTGTSRAYVDNWCVGFTHERTVAVWVGNFDGQPMRKVSGITGAGPIFKRVMIRAMQGINPAPLVDRARFDTADVCPLSGRLAGPSCPARVREIFLRGTAPRDICPMHFESGGKPALDVGPEFYAWAAAEGVATEPVPHPAGGERPRLILPLDGDAYLLEPGLPASAQAVPVQALIPEHHAAEIRLDDEQPRSLLPPYATQIAVGPGKHRLELWRPGDDQPLSVAHFTVAGGDP